MPRVFVMLFGSTQQDNSALLGDLTFTPSVDAVLYYEARVYAQGTSTPILATQYLGVPPVNPNTGLSRVNLLAMLNAQAAGNYDVKVAATGSGGTSESAESNAFVVPIVAPLGA